MVKRKLGGYRLKRKTVWKSPELAGCVHGICHYYQWLGEVVFLAFLVPGGC